MGRALKTAPKAWWVLGIGLTLVVGLVLSRQQRPKSVSTPQVSQPARAPEAVAALGRLEPAGDVRRLAAPISGIGGSPRLTTLLVEEGDAVTRGQLLARFDTAPSLVAQRRLLDARLSNLDRRLQVQTRDIGRYRQLSRSGAIPSGELDTRETALLELQGQRNEAWAERERIKAELLLTELRAPIEGVVLKLHARVGERPGDAGVLELGASMRMQAVVEVYESDIDRVQLGQSVSLISENGGFQGTLQGQVIRISPQVRQRSLLSTDPTGDADARVVDVRVALNPADSQRVRDLTGLKVIARLGAVAPGAVGTGG
ncbi:HlyD family efflux transporter periplasmic adaptor subunit [Cyanobium sp. FACHB-13342]|uniref:efflux RND transporter periplasmic adaptor subunit n=1 Tax=Cyanobium sp. FACHB-13342 TaxID=2692793 RepID=UPI001680B90E|nr:HlyD family efflux transporter periplasmic adaptor subunit [Cyanobium sp. FACHB-13342]MBD2423230.1 efflux RND transporter periplasmic adaptor subunit [Cyanobium sp. FACHB-13342]